MLQKKKEPTSVSWQNDSVLLLNVFVEYIPTFGRERHYVSGAKNNFYLSVFTLDDDSHLYTFHWKVFWKVPKLEEQREKEIKDKDSVSCSVFTNTLYCSCI